MDHKKIEVLMVDDDEGDVLMTQEAAAEAKYIKDFHIASDGMEALEFLEKKGSFTDVPTPDLVLLDINMPRMDGFEVLKWMRAHNFYKATPVIMLTTSNADDDILKCYENGANCYITKPVNINELYKVIQSIDEFWSSIAKLPSRRGG